MGEHVATIPLTVDRQTRAVDIAYAEDAVNLYVVRRFVGALGQGKARYPVWVLLWRVDRMRPDNVAQYRRLRQVATDSRGVEWAMSTSVYIRNRTGRLVGWADTTPPTNYQSQERA